MGGDSGGEVDRDMNCLPPRILRTNVEVNLKSQSFDFRDTYEKDINTPQVSEKRDLLRRIAAFLGSLQRKKAVMHQWVPQCPQK
jgi:hypothetical protein